jgi:hypothetical protein
MRKPPPSGEIMRQGTFGQPSQLKTVEDQRRTANNNNMRNKSNFREENKVGNNNNAGGGGMMQRKKSVHFDEPKDTGIMPRNKSVSKIKFQGGGASSEDEDEWSSNKHEDLITRSSNYSNI